MLTLVDRMSKTALNQFTKGLSIESKRDNCFPVRKRSGSQRCTVCRQVAKSQPNNTSPSSNTFELPHPGHLASVDQPPPRGEQTPFQRNVPKGKLFDLKFLATRLLQAVDAISEEQAGGFYDREARLFPDINIPCVLVTYCHRAAYFLFQIIFFVERI